MTCEPDPTLVDKILLLMASGLTAQSVETAAREKLGLTDPAELAATIAAARRRMNLAAHYNRDEELGQAITRLTDLYRRALTAQDPRTALGAQRELNRLLGLYPSGAAIPATDPAGEEAPEDVAPAAERADPRRGGCPAGQPGSGCPIYDAIDRHLEPLGLEGADGPDATYTDLVAAAAAEIACLRSHRPVRRRRRAGKGPPQADH